MKTSDAIAAASLFVSAVAFGYAFLSSRRERHIREQEFKSLRRADITVSETTPPNRSFHTSSLRYGINVHNAGRATAQGLAAELLDVDERQLELHEQPEICLLGPAESKYVEFEVDSDGSRAAALRVKWRDEDGDHSKEFPLVKEPVEDHF